jgi:hypothetical protein
LQSVDLPTFGADLVPFGAAPPIRRRIRRSPAHARNHRTLRVRTSRVVPAEGHIEQGIPTPDTNMSIKNAILNKGWAGKTITREETAERLNSLMRPLIELLFMYDRVLGTAAQDGPAGDLRREMPALRADIGKVSESIMSCGAVAYSGTDLKSADVASNADWAHVLEREQAVERALEEERAVEHQIRSRAILKAVAANSKKRLELLKAVR